MIQKKYFQNIVLSVRYTIFSSILYFLWLTAMLCILHNINILFRTFLVQKIYKFKFNVDIWHCGKYRWLFHWCPACWIFYSVIIPAIQSVLCGRCEAPGTLQRTLGLNDAGNFMIFLTTTLHPMWEPEATTLQSPARKF